MIYKTIVIDHIKKTKKMAAAIEKAVNGAAENGWEAVNFSLTKSGKAIVLFRVPEDCDLPMPTSEEGEAAPAEEPAQDAPEENVPIVPEEVAQAVSEEETVEAVGDAE